MWKTLINRQGKKKVYWCDWCYLCHQPLAGSVRVIYTPLGQQAICEGCHQEIADDHIKGEMFLDNLQSYGQE
jgi:hypothetical protein